MSWNERWNELEWALEWVGMSIGMSWNERWNELEWALQWVGMSVNCVKLATGHYVIDKNAWLLNKFIDVYLVWYRIKTFLGLMEIYGLAFFQS